MSTRQLADLIGVKVYDIGNALTFGLIEPPKVRIGSAFLWDDDSVVKVREHFRANPPRRIKRRQG